MFRFYILYLLGKPNTNEEHPDYVPNLFSYSKGNRRNACLYEARQKRHKKISSLKKKDDDLIKASNHELPEITSPKADDLTSDGDSLPPQISSQGNNFVFMQN